MSRCIWPTGLSVDCSTSPGPPWTCGAAALPHVRHHRFRPNRNRSTRSRRCAFRRFTATLSGGRQASGSAPPACTAKTRAICRTRACPPAPRFTGAASPWIPPRVLPRLMASFFPERKPPWWPIRLAAAPSPSARAWPSSKIRPSWASRSKAGRTPTFVSCPSPSCSSSSFCAGAPRAFTPWAPTSTAVSS